MCLTILILITLSISDVKASPEPVLPDSPYVDVPVEFYGKFVLVPVSVGNFNLKFILDTAAGRSVISPTTQNAIGFTDKNAKSPK